MLGLGSGSFDPETLVILETAFDEAWITLKTNGSGNIRPDELARRICHLAMEGERDPVRLHDRALGELIPATTWRELAKGSCITPEMLDLFGSDQHVERLCVFQLEP